MGGKDTTQRVHNKMGQSPLRLFRPDRLDPGCTNRRNASGVVYMGGVKLLVLT